ncbi:hypothetical protein BSKO_13900 [Bryopsis sp. KO-2023]|nr:hypothetical protein BSKO_13900 [Bryopsis sp. KO-2023]
MSITPLIFVQVAALFVAAACQSAEWIGSFPAPTEAESTGGGLASNENEKWKSLQGDFSSKPISTCRNGRLFVFGLNQSNQPYAKTYKEDDDENRKQRKKKRGKPKKRAPTFSGKWATLKGRYMALAAASTGDRLFLFGRGIGNIYWVKARTRRGWSQWNKIGGPFFSDPAVATDGRKVVVAARAKKNGVWVRIHGGKKWGGWKNIGGEATSDPAVTINGKEIHVFVLGWKNDLQHAGFVDGKWSEWKSFGAHLMFQPKAITTPNGEVHVFVVGSKNGLYSKVRKANGEWVAGWWDLKGIQVSPPDLAVDKDGTIHLVARSGKNDLIYRKMVDGKWDDWESIATDGFPNSMPSATICKNELFVFVRGEDNTFYFKEVTEPAQSLSKIADQF